MKSCFTSNNIIISIILIALAVCILINYNNTKEGFGPRWLRTRKNRMMRQMRRSFKPYYNDYFKSLERFRRKWL